MAIACLAPHHISRPFPSPPRTEPTSNMSPQRFVSSPYLSDEHHLDLSSVTKASQQLAVALSSLRPIADDYPSQPYPTSFNWQEIIDQLPSEFTGEFCCVGFYSTLKPDVDTTKLHYFDSLAHAEANQSGGLLKYWWQTVPDPSSRKNLATCVWETWDQAKQAGRLPMHAKAMSITRDSYEKWNVERFYLRISEGNKWEIETLFCDRERIGRDKN